MGRSSSSSSDNDVPRDIKKHDSGSSNCAIPVVIGLIVVAAVLVFVNGKKDTKDDKKEDGGCCCGMSTGVCVTVSVVIALLCGTGCYYYVYKGGSSLGCGICSGSASTTTTTTTPIPPTTTTTTTTSSSSVKK